MVLQSDPLERLYGDQEAVDREALAEVLADKVRLDRAGTFQFKPGVRDRLVASHKVLVALLARKALAIGREGFTEGASPRELEGLTDIGGGTLRPILKRLADSNFLSRNGGLYVVPNHAFEDVRVELERGKQ